MAIFVGAKVAQKVATFLEENEIFVHIDDDDDWLNKKAWNFYWSLISRSGELKRFKAVLNYEIAQLSTVSKS